MPAPIQRKEEPMSRKLIRFAGLLVILCALVGVATAGSHKSSKKGKCPTKQKSGKSQKKHQCKPSCDCDVDLGQLEVTVQRLINVTQDQQKLIDRLIAEVRKHQVQIGGLNALLAGVTRVTDPNTSQDTLRFEDMNLQVVNGTGTTDGLPTGTGNIIIGYNELGNPVDDRAGSHMLVLGMENSYTVNSFGGILAGRTNTTDNMFASVSGGHKNMAAGPCSSVSGGSENVASGPECSSVSGGMRNTASGMFSAVSGGHLNTASGPCSSVSGGSGNTASGPECSSVSGGQGNEATGKFCSVSGGRMNVASADWASVQGGEENMATSMSSSVGGGYKNVASGGCSSVNGGRLNKATNTCAAVSGGRANEANGQTSTIGGGASRVVSGDDNWRAGEAFEVN